MTREEWLQNAVKEEQHWLAAVTNDEQPDIHVSIGFTGSKCRLDKVLGSCWRAEYSMDGKPHIFISPVNAEAVDAPQGILATLLHELVHAYVGVKGHGKPFIKVAQAVGLEKPWTATRASNTLQTKLSDLALQLGEFQHSPIKIDTTKQQRVTEIMLGTPLGGEARIVIPSEDEYGDPVPSDFLQHTIKEAAELFGGYTAFKAQGGYIGATGALHEELVTVLDIGMKNNRENKEKLEHFADEIRLLGRQDSVYLRLPSGKVELIDGE